MGARPPPPHYNSTPSLSRTFYVPVTQLAHRLLRRKLRKEQHKIGTSFVIMKTITTVWNLNVWIFFPKLIHQELTIALRMICSQVICIRSMHKIIVIKVHFEFDKETLQSKVVMTKYILIKAFT